MKYLSTSELAKAVGIHPNTVRRYEEWKRIPPVERTPSGYRRFTQRHLDCLRVAHLVYFGYYPGKAIRKSGDQIVILLAGGDLGGSLELAYQHLALIRSERVQADTAASLLERWAQGATADATSKPLQIGQVAEYLGVSIDILRNWERSGLIDVPRNPANGYRLYGQHEISRLRVIRMLSRSGYSLMAILRMLVQLDRGETSNLRQALDTPREDENIYMAADRWISTLNDQEQRALQIITIVEEMIAKESKSR